MEYIPERLPLHQPPQPSPLPETRYLLMKNPCLCCEGFVLAAAKAAMREASLWETELVCHLLYQMNRLKDRLLSLSW